MSLSTMQLEAMLDRKVMWAGSSITFSEYIIGRYRTMRVRVRGDRFADVMGTALTIEQIQAGTT